MSKGIKGIMRLLIDFALFCLMILGVCGVMYKFLMPDGWIKTWMHDIWQLKSGYALAVAAFLPIAFLLGKRWLNGFHAESSLGDLVMYGWMALGLYFAVKLLITGGW